MQEGMNVRPEHYTEIRDAHGFPFGMSNFGHEIDPGFEKSLVGKPVFGTHSGWNFNGEVWHAHGKFHEDVYRYHAYQETISADTLSELMELVNARYGEK